MIVNALELNATLIALSQLISKEFDRQSRARLRNNREKVQNALKGFFEEVKELQASFGYNVNPTTGILDADTKAPEFQAYQTQFYKLGLEITMECPEFEKIPDEILDNLIISEQVEEVILKIGMVEPRKTA